MMKGSTVHPLRRDLLAASSASLWPLWAAGAMLVGFYLCLVHTPYQPLPAHPRPVIGWYEDQRVAWIVPFLSAPAMPPYAALCLRTIAHSSPFVHLFVFYENASMVIPPVEADNIHYVNIGRDEVAMRLIKELQRGLGEPQMARTSTLVKETLRKNPRKVGLYKPLLGGAFQDHIQGFSHWAWGDIDTLVGDVVGLVDADDLRMFDIISFNNGKGLLYLQGQLTILANKPDVLHAWQHAPGASSLTTSKPVFAWEETLFTDWVLHDSSFRVKLMPLQFSGKDGKKWPKEGGPVLVWDLGRLLLHYPVSPNVSALPETRIEAPLKYQETWTTKPQRPGPWVLERKGSARDCSWYGWRQAAHAYDNRTHEFVIFHYNYVHEDKVPSALANKNEAEMQMLLEAPRIVWQYAPFDFREAPPCDSPGGGHCRHYSRREEK